jgi:putative transposase
MRNPLVLEVHVTRTRDRRGGPALLRRALKRFGSPRIIVTDRVRSCRAALSVLGIRGRQDTTNWLNNRAEKSHQPFRRRDRSMQRSLTGIVCQSEIGHTARWRARPGMA